MAGLYSQQGCYLIFDVNYESCDDEDNCLTIAFEVQDTYLIWDKNPQHLADKMSSLTGMDVEIYPVTGSGGIIEAIDKGNADIGFVDERRRMASMGSIRVGCVWRPSGSPMEGFTTMPLHGSRLTPDIAAAHLDDDPDTDPFALMEGKKSCHTGWLKSAGMLIPMGYLIGNGYADVIGDPNDIDSLRATVTNFFSEDSSIPEGGTQYSGYKGAMKCMMTGYGDVALTKDTAYRLYCDENDDGVADGDDWCMDLDELVMLSFGKAPSHPALYNPDTMDIETVEKVQNALVSLNEDAEGREILSDLLNTDGMVATNADDPLGNLWRCSFQCPGNTSILFLNP